MKLLLKILKTVGKVLLWAAAVIFILFLVLIFCPIFYEIKGEAYDKAKAEAEIKALFGILKINLGYDNNGMSAVIKIFGKKLKIFENDEESRESDDLTENNEESEKKDSSEGASGDLRKPKENTVPVKTVKTAPADEGKKEKSAKTLPEKNSFGKTETVQKTVSRRFETPKETDKSIVTAEWQAEEAEEKEVTVKRVKLSELKIPDEPKKNENVKIKYVKMPEEKEEDKEDKENKGAENGERGKDERKQPERLNLEYFKNMPSEERKKLFSAVVRLLKSLFRGVKPRDFYLKGKIGLSDPAYTGVLVGSLWSIGGLINKRIEVQTSFDEEVIEGEFSAKGHIVPAFMMFYIIRFIAVKPVRKIIILLIKGDKNGK